MQRTLLIAFAPLIIFLNAAPAPVVEKKETQWYSLEEAQKLARAEDKKVLVYVYAKNNQQCQRMSYRVYASPRVSEIIHTHFYAAKINAYSNEPVIFNGKKLTEEAFAKQFNINSYPTILFLDSNGEIITLQGGFIERETFNKLLVFVGSDAYKRQEFDQFSYSEKNRK